MIDRLFNAVRQRRITVIAVALVVLLAASAIVEWTHTSTSGGPIVSSGPSAVARERSIQINRLLAVKGGAVIRGDKAEFMSTVDPRNAKFRRSQRQMFTDLSAVKFKTWSYAMTATPRRAPPNAAKYDDPTWAPSFFALRYRLAHFDIRPTNLQQYPTFVERGGHWYLGSLTDYAKRGLVSATDLWDYGKVTVVHRSDVLVLGFAGQRATMLGVADDVRSAIPQVTQVWGRRWARRAVVLVPGTMRQMALIDSDHESLRQIAALTSAEVSTTAGHPSPVGNRITINPYAWPMLSALGQSIVLRHELTHVATQSATGTQTPTWLSEGFADYVGFKYAGISTSLAGHELQSDVVGGHVPLRLPADRAFRGGAKQLAMHYEAAWFACRTIAERFGQAALVRFYRAVGTSSHATATALSDALTSVLHLKLTRFVALWRHQMRAELG